MWVKIAFLKQYLESFRMALGLFAMRDKLRL
jgi:hypothetical protein